MIRPLGALGVAALLASSCNTPTEEPLAAEVAKLVAPAYVHPDKLGMSAKPLSPSLVVWHRTYDGIDVLAQPKSERLPDGGWETHFIPELQEPPVVLEAERLTLDAAAAQLGLGEQLRNGTVTARYAYQPVFISRPNKPEVTNAFDLDRFIERFVLVIELVDDGNHTTTRLDARTGEVLSRHSHAQAIDVGTTVLADTFNYGVVELDVTGRQQGRGITALKYKDLTRCAFAKSCTRPQGVAAWNSDLAAPLVYLPVNQNVNLSNDYALALQMSWDYFATAHAQYGTGQRPLDDRYAAMNTPVLIAIPRTDSQTNFHVGSGAFNHFGTIYVVQQADAATNIREATIDIIGHEWAHSLYWTYALAGENPNGFLYGGENGGLTEASSDLFGVLIEAFALNRMGFQPSPDVEDSAWTIAGRNMCSPGPGYSDTWTASMRNELFPPMEPHRASAPVDRVHCLVARGLRRYGTAPSWEPGLESELVPDGFDGIGSQALARIWFRTLAKLNIHESPFDFSDARRAELAAAAELYGEYSAPYNAVEDAWAAVGVGFPADRTPPEVSLLTQGTMTPWRSIEFTAFDLYGVAELAIWVDNGPVTRLTSPPWLYLPEAPYVDGPHVVHVKATDGRNVFKFYDFVVTFDSNVPAVSTTDVTPCPSADWCPDYRMTRKYRINASDYSGVRKLELLVDDVVVGSVDDAGTATFDHDFPDGGTYALTVRATDGVNLTGNTTVGQALIDTTPPTIYTYASQLATPSATLSGLVTWDFCSADGAGAIPPPNRGLLHSTLELDGRPIIPALDAYFLPRCIKFNVINVARGPHAYVLRVPDKWGNVATQSGTFTVINGPQPVDTTPPVVSLSLSGSASPFVVTASATDASALQGAQFLVDGVVRSSTANQPYAFSYAPSDAATHTLSVRVTDVAGNVGSASIGAPLDLVGPTATLVAHQLGAVVTIDVSVADPCGLQTPFGFYLDGALFLSLSGSSTVALSAAIPNGPHIASVQLSDRCGNGTQVHLPFTKSDAVPPVITGVTVDNSNLKQPKFTVTCTSVTSTIDHVEVRRNGSIIANDATAPYEFTLDTSAWPDGSETILFHCSDAVGLASDPVTRTVAVDNTPPAFTLTVTAAGYQHVVSATVTDAHAITSVTLRGGLVGGFSTTLTNAPWAVGYTMPAVTQSQFPFGITVRDSWGNEATRAFLCNVDTTVTTTHTLSCVPWT